MPQHDINEIHGSWFDPSNQVVPMDGSLRVDLLAWLKSWEGVPDLVTLALGTSLSGMNADSIAAKANVVIISLQETLFDSSCLLRIYGKLDQVFELLASALSID